MQPSFVMSKPATTKEEDVKSYPTTIAKLTAVTAFCLSVGAAFAQPAPVNPVPNARVIDNLENEVITFFHFGINTFNNREWGDEHRDYDVNSFNPTAFDATNWIDAAKDMGTGGIIMVAKHHDGFINWVSDTDPNYGIRATSWYNSTGTDLVKEVADAANAQGIPFGVYLSIWDQRFNRQHGKNGTAYAEYYKQQVSELLGGNYGPIRYIWLDGAGSDEQGLTQTQFQDIYDHIYNVSTAQGVDISVQLAGSDIRWLGNEEGHGFDTQWNLIRPGTDLASYAMAPDAEQEASDLSVLGLGSSVIASYSPKQADTRVLQGWFWRTNPVLRNDAIPMFFTSVGKGTQLLWNYSPDNRGLVPQSQRDHVKLQSEMRELTFGDGYSRNMLYNASISSTSSVYGGDTAQYGGQKAVDGDTTTYWATPDGTENSQITFEFQSPVTADVISMREYQRLGQRIGSGSVDIKNSEGTWAKIADFTTVGSHRILQIDEQDFHGIRFNFQGTRGAPLINELGLYKFASSANVVDFSLAPGTEFYGEIYLSLIARGGNIYYTTDGSAPTSSSTRYVEPIRLTETTTVNAVLEGSDTVFTGTYTQVSPIHYQVRLDNAKLSQSSSLNSNTPATAANDGNTSGDYNDASMAHTAESDASPWWMAELDELESVDLIRFYNRTDCCSERLAGATVYLSPVEITSTIESDVAQIDGVVRADLPRIADRIVDSVHPGVETKAVIVFGKNGPINISEIEIYAHAQDKLSVGNATQSSTHSGAVASRAIDGNTDGDYFQNSVAHTEVNIEGVPWWRAELDGVQYVETVKIYNRTDCCGNREAGARVYFSNEEFNNPTELQAANQLNRSVVTLDGNKSVYTMYLGRPLKYATIFGYDGQPLNIAEVEFYGKNGVVMTVGESRKLAFDVGSARQSSSHPSGEASKALDGNTDGRFFQGFVSHTGDDDTSPWWEGRLEYVSFIESLKIYNRTDCCGERLNEAKIYVKDTAFDGASQDDVTAQADHIFTLPANVGESVTVNMSVVGRYIRVYGSTGQPLAIAEMEATGSQLAN